MVALLEEHNQFIFFPEDNSEDAELAQQGGYLAIDGSTIDLFTKPAYFGETFYDRKSKYSLGCQVVIMPHNLMIVDYSLGQPGKHANLLPDDHWVWADSAYPLEPWCIPPFKKPLNRQLTKDQKTFNYHLSKIHSLRELCINIQTEKDLQVAVHWIKCCLILHNMIICFETHHCKQDKNYDQSLE
ncbi:hypothetical protein BDR06DRAFT_1044727 [Suillus hirtellus]|nr:hypothetical protein BDR06DRAFT_1044727 [Suillus hirtellus]